MKLIPFTPAHFSTLASWFTTEAALIQFGGPNLTYPLDAPQMQAMLAEGDFHPPLRLCWMAVAEDAVVGHAQLAFDWRNGTARLGRVAIAPTLRGRKLAAPMLRLVMAEAFKNPTKMRLELNAYAFNQVAIHTYLTLGFLVEGTLRSSVAVGADRWDTVVMAVLRSDYHPA